MKSVSVIIPNFNGQQLLASHLPAVFTLVRDHDQIIIVDDCSTDDSVEWLVKTYHLQAQEPAPSGTHNVQQDYQSFSAMQKAQEHKEIELILIRNLKNLRFAAASNRGVSRATSDLILLLNSDVEPASNVLEFLVPHFEDPFMFAVGCLEQEPHQAKITYSGKNVLEFKRGMFIHQRAENMESGETAWVSGGSGMFDRQKWLLLKGFDTAYSPAYWEDVDLSFRARERGWKVVFESRAKVTHNHESTNIAAFGKEQMQRMSWNNANYFVIKNSTWLQKIQYVLWKPYWAWKLHTPSINLGAFH